MMRGTPALIISVNKALEIKERVVVHRRSAVHPYGKKRTDKGQFDVTYEDLRRFPDKFYFNVLPASLYKYKFSK